MLSYGDSITNAGFNDAGKATQRGVFGYKSRTRIVDISDGSSNTILMSEQGGNADETDYRGQGVSNIGGLATNPSVCLAQVAGGKYTAPPCTANNLAGCTGTYICNSRTINGLCHSGVSTHIGFSTVLPPNSPNCFNTARDDSSWGLVSATSHHAGGVNVLMGDGAVKFVSNSVNAGNSAAPEPKPGEASPYGVWGAMGTMNGGEAVTDTN